MVELSLQDYLRIKSCRDGLMMFNPKDAYVGRSLDVYGEFSRSEADIFDQVVRSGDVVLDVGANIGAHTVHLSKVVGNSGKVFSFEPQLGIFNLMCANLALNNITNVEPFRVAVGANRGKITVPRLDMTQGGNFGAVQLGSSIEGDCVDVVAIDDLNLPSCRFIKIDIEGMEQEAIIGARKTLEIHQPVLYLEYEKKETSGDLINLLSSIGYDSWWSLPSYYNLDNHFGVTENIFENRVSPNIVCIHRASSFEIRNAEPVQGPDDSWERPAIIGDRTGTPVHLRPRLEISIK